MIISSSFAPEITLLSLLPPLPCDLPPLVTIHHPRFKIGIDLEAVVLLARYQALELDLLLVLVREPVMVPVRPIKC